MAELEENSNPEPPIKAIPIQDAPKNETGQATKDRPPTPQRPKSQPAPQCYSNNSTQTPNGWWRKWDNWKRVLEVGAFVLGLFFAWVYHGQWKVMSDQLTAMSNQTSIASQSLALTKQVIESSEAAFIDWDVRVISFHAQTVSIVFKNSGHLPARNVVGTVTLKRMSKSGKVIQSTVRPFTRNVISPNGGFIDELIGMTTDEDLNSLVGQDAIATGVISFDDGVKRSTQQFCSGMIVVLNGAAHWENCENLADHKKYMHDY